VGGGAGRSYCCSSNATVQLNEGADRQIKALQQDNVELLVTGESREWETVPYVQDAAAEGRHKALILLGHDISEEAGMEECARWLRTVLPGMPVESVAAGEPFRIIEARSK
jgi:hypothetical protein